MPRLRTTSTLSLLALIIGIAGTGWLSTLTSQWRGMPPQHAPARSAVAVVRHQHADRISRRLPRHQDAKPVVVRALAFRTNELPLVASTPPELRPLAMPTLDSRPWQTLRGHLDGRVLMHLQIDGDGRVITASVATSSGDSVLDAHALDSVRHWLFVVPDGHPEGIEGDLPMRFASAGSGLAAAP
jgi:protein TonB